jgi:hypothetical protein
MTFSVLTHQASEIGNEGGGPMASIAQLITGPRFVEIDAFLQQLCYFLLLQVPATHRRPLGCQ